MNLMDGPCDLNYVAAFAGPQASTYMTATCSEALLSDVNATFSLCGAQLTNTSTARGPLPLAPENAGLHRTERIVSYLREDYTSVLAGPTDGNRANFTNCLRGALVGAIQGRLDADRATYEKQKQANDDFMGYFSIGFVVLAILVVVGAAGSGGPR